MSSKLSFNHNPALTLIAELSFYLPRIHELVCVHKLNWGKYLSRLVIVHFFVGWGKEGVYLFLVSFSKNILLDGTYYRFFKN